MIDAILTLAAFSAFALIWGAFRIKKRDGASQKFWLMLVVAAIILGNIAIWVVPNEKGRSLAAEAKS